mmetsp:Transcript_61536/g.105853  ORF Transcript_61536/g.105853 Transcript_61536/m.105853 type:complete len:94 (-) Transcript_61536:123-404(-)
MMIPQVSVGNDDQRHAEPGDAHEKGAPQSCLFQELVPLEGSRSFRPKIHLCSDPRRGFTNQRRVFGLKLSTFKSSIRCSLLEFNLNESIRFTR